MIQPVMTLGAENQVIRVTFPPPRGAWADGAGAYVITDGPHWSVVDTGWPTPSTLSDWHRVVETLGLDWANLRQIILTHLHPDHDGQAAALQALASCPVLVHDQAYADSLNQSKRHAEGRPEWLKYMARTGLIPPGSTKSPLPENESIRDLPKEFVLLGDDARIDCGSCTLQVLHTPGHAPGHLCLLDSERRFLVSGDLILPHMHPHVSTGPGGPVNPVAQYLQSISLVETGGADFILPSHGQPFHGLADRIVQIRAHYEKRAQQICMAVGAGHSTAIDIAKHMKWRGQRFGDMEDVSRFFIINVIMSHLVYLESAGEVTRVADEELFRFAIR